MASSSDFVDVSKPDPGVLTIQITPGAFGRQASAEFRRHLMFLHSMPLVVHMGNQKFQLVAQLDTQGEFESIVAELESLHKGIHVEAKVATQTSVSSAFSLDVPCVHFSCHGEDVQNGQDQHDGYLLLEHESGDQDSQFGLAHSVVADAFSRHLQNHDGAKVIEFVFVSACHSLEVGKKFEAFGIKHVIAVDQTQKIKDVAAQRFSKTLYRMLFSGSTVKQAFDQAKFQLSSCDDIDYNGNPVIVDAENQASRFRLLGAGPHDRPLDFIRHLSEGHVRDESLPMSRYLPRNENFKIQPRQEDLFRLMKQMTHMRSKLLVVHGPPSIGKSSLLLESVRYMSARGRQLAWIPCSESSPEVPHLQAESFKDSDFQSQDLLCSFIGRALGIPGVNNFNDLTQHRGRLARSWVVFDGADELTATQKELLFAPKIGLVTCLCEHIRCVITCQPGAHFGLFSAGSRKANMADSAHLVPVRALSDDSSLSLYNLLVQDKVDRLKSLTADQTRRLHDHVFLGSPHRICYAARLRQQSEQKGGVFDEIVAILTQYDEQSKAHALDQELGIQPTIRLPSQPAASVVEASIAGASPVDGAFPAPSGKLLEFSAAAALPRAGSALVSSASPSAAASASVGPPRQHVMVSYAWDDAKDRVVRFCDALRQHQIDVWRDETGSSLLGPMADAVNAHMAKAVELCSTMIVCVSRKYMVSINCKREFEYASTLQKPMIFVMLDETYTTVSPERVDGDVGFILGGKLWYALFSDVNMSRAVADVSARILNPVAAPRLLSQLSAAIGAPPASATTVMPGSAYGAMPFSIFASTGSPVSASGYGGMPMFGNAMPLPITTAEGAWSAAATITHARQPELALGVSLPWRVISEVLVDVFNQVGRCGGAGARRPLLLADVNTFCVQWRSKPLCTSDQASGHWILSKELFLVFFEWFKSCALLCSKIPATWNIILSDPFAPQKEAPAFRGFITAYQSAALLQGCPVGTFLLRFSESSASTVTLSRVADTDRVEHNKIAFVESARGGAFVVDGQAGQSYSSIEEFIVACPLISSVAPNHDKRHVFSFAPAPVLAATATASMSPFQNASVHGAWMKAANNYRSLRMLPPSSLFDGNQLPWDIVSAVLIDEFNAASQCSASRPVTRNDIDKFRDVWARKSLCARDQFGCATLAPAAFSEFYLWLVSCAQLCMTMPATWSRFVTSSQGVATPIFFGFATAVESETMLNGHQPGTFLLRFSETSHSTVTLTRVVDNFGRKEHNKIVLAGGCFSFDTPGSTPCQTLEECVLNCGVISHVFPGVDKRQVFVVSAPAPAPAPAHALQRAGTAGNPVYGMMAAIQAPPAVAAGNPVYGIMAAGLNHASSVAPAGNSAYGIMGAGAILAPSFAFRTRAAHEAWSLGMTRAASQSGMPLAPRAPLPWLVIREVLVESFNASGQCANAHPIVADDVDKFCIEWAQKPMCTRNAKSLLVLTDEAFSQFFEWFISCADLVRRCPESWGRFVPASHGSAAQVPVILGFLTGAEANSRLQGQPAGTFLLRFSERAKSTITVSRVDSSGRLEHNRIVFTDGAQGGRFAFDGQGSVQYPTLEECVLKCTVITHVWPGYEKSGVFGMVADGPF